jgi:tetratricopeptide (TPR) repeat protein
MHNAEGHSTDFSLLLPTRGRPASVQRFLQSVAQTASSPEKVEVIIYADEDDPETQRISFPGLKLIKLVGHRETMGNLNRACYEASSGRYVMLVNDDLVFRTHGWDTKIRQGFYRFPDEIAIVYANDLIQGERLAAFPILSRVACEIIDCISPSEYLRTGIDTHIFAIFKILSRFGYERIVYLQDVIMEHMHHSIGKSSFDRTCSNIDPFIDLETFASLSMTRLYAAFRLARYIERFKLEEQYRLRQPPPQNDCVRVIVTGKPEDGYIERLINQNQERTPFEVVVGDSERLEGLIQGAKGGIIVFLDPGCIPSHGWLDRLVQTAMSSPEIKVVGPKLVNTRSGRIEHAGICYLKQDGKLKPTCIYQGMDADSPVVNRVREFQAVTDLCMLVKREAIGEALKGGVGEICYRVRSNGGKVVYEPGAVLYYEGPLRPNSPAQAQPDLDSLLAQDGYIRHSTHRGDCILPSEKKINKLKADQRFVELFEVLEDAILLAREIHEEDRMGPFYEREREQLHDLLLTWERKNIFSLIQFTERENLGTDATAQILFFKGMLFEEAGGTDQALVYFERALQYCRHQILKVNILLHKYMMLKAKGRQEMAVECLREAMDQRAGSACLSVGNYFRERGNSVAALTIYKAGIQSTKEPNLRIRFVYASASTLKDLGMYHESIQGFNEVLSFQLPMHMFHMMAGAHFHLGDNYARLGHRERAIHHLKMCLKEMPAHRKARELLEGLTGTH